MSKFEIGEFAVDVTRCQIVSREECTTIEPKVMDVLKILYENKGEVVSQETIFNAVWPRATFSPSSVQRSIAILRKALKEDAKNPRFIITHPKRGYSLSLPTPITQQSKTPRSYWHLFTFVLITLIVAGVGLLSTHSTSVQTEFNLLRPINSLESNEFSFVLSPSGEHIAFIREIDNKQSIWLKNLATGEEVVLLKDEVYTQLGWHPLGNALAFVTNQENAQQLGYVTFDPITLAPLERTQVMSFTEHRVSSHNLAWADNHKIYFVERHLKNNDTQLSTIDLTTKQKQVIYSSKGQDWLLVHALSPDQNTIALGFEAGQNNYRIDLINLTTNQVSKLATIDDGLSGLSWHPNGEHLLLSKRHQLLTVSLAGEINHIAFNNFKIVRDAQYNKLGDEILLEQVAVDVDIIAAKRDALNTFETLVNTSSVDFLPVYSPTGDKFVFESHRFGQKQLFLYFNNQQTLLFDNPNNHELFGVVWNKQGDKIFTASKDTVFRIDINTRNVETIANPHHSFYLRDVFSDNTQLLVSYRDNSGTTHHPAIFNLETGSLTPFQADGKKLSCSALSLDQQDRIYFSNGQTVYRVNNGEFDALWQSASKDIIGLTVNKDTLHITHESNGEYHLSEHNILTEKTSRVKIGDNKGKMLINASPDYETFLYLTEPKRKKSLVRLL